MAQTADGSGAAGAGQGASEAPRRGGGMHGRCCGGRRHTGGVGRGALVEPAVIAALLREGGHGYDLRKTIAELTADDVNVDAGGLYRVLRRLEEEGFVRSTWVEGETGPQRREYELTAEARELAQDWIAHLRERERLAGLLADVLERALADSGREA